MQFARTYQSVRPVAMSLRSSSALVPSLRTLWRRGPYTAASFSSTVDSPVDKPVDFPGASTSPPASDPLSLPSSLKPSEVVSALDRHIVGQADAKKAVAIALRNRWRRRRIGAGPEAEDLRREITPRNVLMIGPTGCGKTEVARRMARMSDAPFLKVEATKFTEVGYHGRDVDQIVRDLVDVSLVMTKRAKTEELRADARAAVDGKVLDLLVGERADARARDSYASLLAEGHLEDAEVTVDVPEGLGETPPAPAAGGNGIAISFSEAGGQSQSLADVLSRVAGAGGRRGGSASERKKMPVREARKVLEEIELQRLLEPLDLTQEALRAVEEDGIVFLDEIDKICSNRDYARSGADASAEGVQRDLLPLIEGCTISTKHGNVQTDYILFIASGAFHSCKPSDLLPELQGRLPIRVELQGLTEHDLYRILTEPVGNLLRQQTELIATEGVALTFDDDAIREMAKIAALLNKTVENIGARRLHTVLERILEEISFTAAEMEEGATVTVTKDLVNERLANLLVGTTDLKRYIL